jgi:hypothetical protein
MRLSEEQYAAEIAKRTRWQRGSEVVSTDQRAKADAGSRRLKRSDTPDAASSPPSKYRNVKTDGYASRKEAKRASALRLMQEAGQIADLREQVPYVLIPRALGPDGKVAERACSYVADFVYREFGAHQDTVEDCKGVRTADYVIKRKLMRFVHGVVVRET